MCENITLIGIFRLDKFKTIALCFKLRNIKVNTIKVNMMKQGVYV